MCLQIIVLKEELALFLMADVYKFYKQHILYIFSKMLRWINSVGIGSAYTGITADLWEKC